MVVRWAAAHPFRAAVVVAVVGLAALVVVLVLGASTSVLPDPATVSSPTARPTADTPVTTPAVEPGDSGHVSSSTGVDWGASLPRLGESPFALTTDPVVFAASVQAATGYDYSSYQPTNATEEQQRISAQWLAGMTGEDGPLGPEIHRVLRNAVGQSLDPDELAYRVAAQEVDTVDVLAVERTDNAALRADAGNEIYLAVIGHRDTLYALTTVATVTTELQQVGDVSGYTRTQTTVTSMIVRCDPAVNDGFCDLVGVIGGGVR